MILYFDSRPKLSEKEMVIARQSADGLINKEIGEHEWKKRLIGKYNQNKVHYAIVYGGFYCVCPAWAQ